MSEIKLGWGSAEVKDAKLTVALDGKVPRGWKQSFERTVRLLGDGEWGAVQLRKGAVQVVGVTPGTEEKLRHHLDAIVAQANSTLQRSESDDDADDAADRGGGEQGERRGPDAEMTAA